MLNKSPIATVSTLALLALFAISVTGCSKEDSTSTAAVKSEESIQVAAVSEPAVTTPTAPTPPPRNAPPAAQPASGAPEGWSSGPEIGTKIPDFNAVDQNGVSRTFADIVGPEGAYIVFQRSADW